MLRSRTILVIASACSLGAAAVLACTGGEAVEYDTAGLTGDGGIPEGAIVDDSGRVIFESGVPVQERPEAATLPPPNPVACNGLVSQDGGCDTSAGRGCCLDNTGALCEEQAQYSAGAFCNGAGSVFITCTSSFDDSICCWQNDGPGGSTNTRYRSACDGGVEACDPSQDGGVCANGQLCTPTACSKAPTITIGFCGAPPAGVACP